MSFFSCILSFDFFFEKKNLIFNSATVAAVEEAFQSVIQESGTTEIQNLPVIVPEKERNSFVYDGSAQQDPVIFYFYFFF